MKSLLTFLLLTTGIFHAADIPFTLEKPGKVSAAIYDAQGRMVRELTRAVPMNAGQHSLVLDGSHCSQLDTHCHKHRLECCRTLQPERHREAAHVQ